MSYIIHVICGENVAIALASFPPPHAPRTRLNIKTVFPGIGIPIIKMRMSTAAYTVPIWRSRSQRPDKNRRERHGRLMKSWQHRTDILEVCSVGKRSAVIAKPVRQFWIIKLYRDGRDCSHDLAPDRTRRDGVACMIGKIVDLLYPTCVDSRGQRVGSRGQRHRAVSIGRGHYVLPSPKWRSLESRLDTLLWISSK